MRGGFARRPSTVTLPKWERMGPATGMRSDDTLGRGAAAVRRHAKRTGRRGLGGDEAEADLDLGLIDQLVRAPPLDVPTRRDVCEQIAGDPIEPAKTWSASSTA